MAGLRVFSASEQVAAHLREQLASGRWRDVMPGEDHLLKELGVGRNTIQGALKLLDEEGLLVSQGPGRRRQIVLDQVVKQASSCRVKLLLYEKVDRKTDYLVELIHRLQSAGHDSSFSDKSMNELGMDVRRISRYVTSTEADAWVVASGPADVLQWFSNHSTPTFALFGRLMNVPLASTSPRKAEAYDELVDTLVELGHRRIIRIVRGDRRKPTPGFLEQRFLDRLRHHGIPSGSYNLPDWEESPEGLQDLLSSLFQLTPPTAMIVDGVQLFSAVRNHLACRGIQVPDQVSLICTDPDPSFNWWLPRVSHITWDSEPWLRRVVQWVNNISRGKDDRRKTSNKARFVSGGTHGIAPHVPR